MNLLLLLCCVLMTEGQPQPLTRISYYLELNDGEKSVVMRMYLNHLSVQNFSLTCRKAPTGHLFTYWATPDQDILFFPLEDMAFLGQSGQVFQLFTNGPKLVRQDWLKLLMAPDDVVLEGVSISKDGEWYVARWRDFRLRWRERSRTTKQDYSQKVLFPKLEADTHIKALADLPRYWSW